MNLLPIIKWTGGKRREIKHFYEYIPAHNTFIEPFIGGGALYWYHNFISGHNIINDFEPDLINFYNVVKDHSDNLLSEIDKLKKLNGNHDLMEKKYYEFRENKNTDDVVFNAIKFLYVNQLAFSGMRRFNSKGEFNVPFGHYKSFNPKITKDHINLLKNTLIMNDDTLSLLKRFDIQDSFIFLDPPYTKTFKTYSFENCFDDIKQKELASILSSMKKSKWMVVINDSEEIRSLYKDFIISSYNIKYGVNIKNRFNTDVKHLIITNYPQDDWF